MRLVNDWVHVLVHTTVAEVGPGLGGSPGAPGQVVGVVGLLQVDDS